ncbi:tripartite tricarboxylate transporter substrate binding protein [soil metagenome]
MVATVAPAAAQTPSWPAKQVRIIVPYAAGGGVDIVARTLGDELGKRTGKPVIIENRAGAGGNIGSEYVVRSDPDGYTLLLASNSNAVNNSLYVGMSYDAGRDLAPVILIGKVPLVLLVSPSYPAKSVSQLLGAARAAPGSINFASSGNGTAEHLILELFKRRTGIDVVHVPYKGAPPAYTDLMSGQVQAMFTNPVGAAPYLKSGQLRALGVTGPVRVPQLPDVPTLAEQGIPDFNVTVWWGLMGPAGMPKETVAQINAAIATVLASPDVVKRLESLGARAEGGSPEQFATFFRSERSTWDGVIKAANIKLE